MFPKPSEDANGEKIKNSSSKSNTRSRLKTTLGGSLKEKSVLHTNIPLSVTLIKARSQEKDQKSKFIEKLNRAEEKSIKLRRTNFQKQKTNFTDNSQSVLEKVVEASRDNIFIPTKDIPTSKRQTEENKPKFKGFSHLLPLCEKELKKIEDAWLNTIYCSLSVRANLVKFLIQSFPSVDRNQFNTEDMKLVQCFDQVKTSTKTEIYNLLNLVKSILTDREKIKEEHHALLKSDNSCYNKKTETEDVSKQPKAEGLTPQKKKETSDTSESDTEKSQKSGKTSNKNKDKSFMSFFSFRSRQNSNSLPKENESTSKGNAQPNAEEAKTEVVRLTSIQKDFEDLKTKYLLENETYEQKIKDLESLLEEKIKILKQEKEMKNQLQTCLGQFQAQQRRLTKTIGYEQLEHLIGRSSRNRDKRLEELWLTAIKLILNGFFIQLKNLEMERNTMLFQLQSNDTENFNALAASIIQKDNFVKSIKQQMQLLNKAYQKSKNKENLS